MFSDIESDLNNNDGVSKFSTLSFLNFPFAFNF